jgi:hypothetical protein
VFYENKDMFNRFLENMCVSHVLFTSFFIRSTFLYGYNDMTYITSPYYGH